MTLSLSEINEFITNNPLDKPVGYKIFESKDFGDLAILKITAANNLFVYKTFIEKISTNGEFCFHGYYLKPIIPDGYLITENDVCLAHITWDGYLTLDIDEESFDDDSFKNREDAIAEIEKRILEMNIERI